MNDKFEPKKLLNIEDSAINGQSKWMPVIARSFDDDDGNHYVHHIVKKGDVVGVLPITSDGRIPVTVQARAGANKQNSVELPAGRLQKGKTPLETAIAEANEEAGVVITGSTEIIELPPYWADQAGVESLGHLYIFDGVEVTGKQHLDDGEILKYELIPAKSVIEMVEDGIINDANSVIIILWARLKGII